ncbi:MAG: Uma2 family endonuclease [Gemmatimonas sp.]
MAMPAFLSEPEYQVPANGIWTMDDLERLPYDGNRHEILHGELLVTPPPSVGHQTIAARLLVKLAVWCQANTGWRYLSPGGVYMSETTWLEPDIAIYPAPEYLMQDWREMAPPVLVVEVWSKSTGTRDRHRKRPAYLAHGVGEMWIVKQSARSVERWTASSEFPEMFENVLVWEPSAAPAGPPRFEMSFDELFGPPEPLPVAEHAQER